MGRPVIYHPSRVWSGRDEGPGRRSGRRGRRRFFEDFGPTDSDPVFDWNPNDLYGVSVTLHSF